MTKHPPTAEQQTIIGAAVQTEDNLLVSALAGAAKTTTLVMLAEALPKKNIVCLAFNKSIAMEMQARLPSNCTALTLNSLGHRVWAQHLKLRRLTLKKNKMYQIVSDLINELPDADKTDAFKEFAYILQAAGHAKASGHLPDKFLRSLGTKAPEPLLDDATLIASLDEETTSLVHDILIRALNISARDSMSGIIDFGDQVLFPSLFRCMYPIYSLILVDETQDLSPLNHRMLGQLYRKRIIAVGDQCQAIYGFRGAFEDGMEQIKRTFDMRELTLSTTFRCPEEIVEHVRWRAPHMRSWEGTPPGSVSELREWSVHDLPEGSAVICRNNAPLISLAMTMLKNGRYPNVWGDDIVNGLVKKLKALGASHMSRDSAITALEEYHEKQKKRVKNKTRLHDTIACLRIFIEASDTLGGAIAYAERIFSTQGKIDLLTGHKSKGGEWDHVFFLDSFLLGKDGQEPNLRYVICTRPKRSLTYLESANLEENKIDLPE